MPESRIDIAPSLVARLVAEQFPQWANLRIRAVEPGGWDNKTFRLGDDMSLRLPSAERYGAQVAKEHRWLPRLAPQVPLAIPVPIALGQPAGGYPWHWSVYRWLEGESASIDRIADLNAFAVTLAQFLIALQHIDPTGGPLPGAHNFFRGGSLSIYDAETRGAIASLNGKIDVDTVTAIWQIALESTWQGAPVWLHGDVSAANLLVHQGNLHAVIDFGCSGIGDPACDYAIAWTLFSGESRKIFRSALSVDDATWARGRGWALWKGLITLAEAIETHPLTAEAAQQTIGEIVTDDKRTG
ncbi:MAG: aminoglycoside phosphotransferase family protein [Cyanobacteria bacterium J06638_22]